jgi:hypothetical protein
MNCKLVIAVALVAIIPVAASVQTDGANTKVPKPTIADAQKLVQMISSDKAKLKAYCDIGKLQEQMESADQKNDTEALDALGAILGESDSIERAANLAHDVSCSSSAFASFRSSVSKPSVNQQ